MNAVRWIFAGIGIAVSTVLGGDRMGNVARIMTLAAALAVTLALAPIAHADSSDDHYLALLSSHGITCPPDQLIADGHQVCDAYGQSGFGIGMSPRMIAILKLDSDLSAQGFTAPHDKQQLALDAVRSYCPQFTPPQ
jgi:hypothetical protein